MKRLIKKASHNYDCRDEALLYIDGEILIGNNHPELIQFYLDDHTDLQNELINEYKELNGNDIPDDRIAWETAMQFSEYERAEANFKSIDDIGLAFGHIVYDEINNDNDEEYDQVIYLETSSMSNVNIQEVITAIQDYYGYEIPIFDDDTYDQYGGFADKYERIAKNKNYK